MTFLRPLLWPAPHLFDLLSSNEPPLVIPPVRSGMFVSVMSHLVTMVAACRSFLLAYIAIHFLSFSGEAGPNPYPAFRSNLQPRIEWFLPILIRNVAAAWIICGLWDGLLHFSPLSKRVAKYKMHSAIQSSQQILHDAVHTTSATICGTLIEAALCMGYSHGYFSYQTRPNMVVTVIAALLVSHWRVPHFYVIHRLMHPWRTKFVPDIGRFLYKHVHSLHHKSYNPTAFSGTSMHPVEALLYYSAAFLPVFFGVHPVVPLTCVVDCAVGAWLGHDGFHSPGHGDYFHELHHWYFDGNYGGGAPFLPLDEWFGTLLTCKEDLKKNWAKVGCATGMEGNETMVHKEGGKVKVS